MNTEIEKSIAQDEREISWIESARQPEFMAFTVTGSGQISKIVAYEENGQMAPIPFYAVYKGEEIAYRVPAADMVVGYKVKS